MKKPRAKNAPKRVFVIVQSDGFAMSAHSQIDDAWDTRSLFGYDDDRVIEYVRVPAKKRGGK